MTTTTKKSSKIVYLRTAELAAAHKQNNILKQELITLLKNAKQNQRLIDAQIALAYTIIDHLCTDQSNEQILLAAKKILNKHLEIDCLTVLLHRHQPRIAKLHYTIMVDNLDEGLLARVPKNEVSKLKKCTCFLVLPLIHKKRTVGTLIFAHHDRDEFQHNQDTSMLEQIVHLLSPLVTKE